MENEKENSEINDFVSETNPTENSFKGELTEEDIDLLKVENDYYEELKREQINTIIQNSIYRHFKVLKESCDFIILEGNARGRKNPVFEKYNLRGDVILDAFGTYYKVVFDFTTENNLYTYLKGIYKSKRSDGNWEEASVKDVYARLKELNLPI